MIASKVNFIILRTVLDPQCDPNNNMTGSDLLCNAWKYLAGGKLSKLPEQVALLRVPRIREIYLKGKWLNGFFMTINLSPGPA